MGWWAAAPLLAVALSVGGCSMQESSHRPWFHDEKNDTEEFSHTHLGDSWEDGSVADFLLPAERDSLARSGTAGLREGEFDQPSKDAAADEAKPEEVRSGTSGTLDKAGKMAVSALGVGLTVGMAIAPYFLF